MNGAFDLRMGESHIEVHKFRTGAILIATLLALVIQAWFPLHFARMALLDLPLLVTIYFGLSRRNPSTGLLPVAGQPQRPHCSAGPVRDCQNGDRLSRFIHRRAPGYRASCRTVRAHRRVPHRPSGGGDPDTPHSARATGTLAHFALIWRRAPQRPRRRLPLHRPRPPAPPIVDSRLRHCLCWSNGAFLR